MKLYIVAERIYTEGSNEWFREESFIISWSELLPDKENANEAARLLNKQYSFKGLLYNGNEDPDQEEELIEPFEVIELEYKTHG